MKNVGFFSVFTISNILRYDTSGFIVPNDFRSVPQESGDVSGLKTKSVFQRYKIYSLLCFSVLKSYQSSSHPLV